MNRFTNIFRFITFALFVSIFASGCNAIRVARAGEMKTEFHTIDVGDATSARVRVEMNLGELKMIAIPYQ